MLISFTTAKIAKATDEHRANAQPESPTAAKKAAKPGKRPPRRARLRLTRIDPWSVMKTSFLLAIAFGVVTVVGLDLGAGAVDAAGGQKAAAAAKQPITDPQLETLDKMLLRRLQLNATSGAASSVVSFQDAQARIDRLRELAASDPASLVRAQGTLDSSRVRGLLD